MKITSWFIRAEDFSTIENPLLLQVTKDVTNDFESDENENFWKYRSFETIRQILLNKYRISQETFVVLYTFDELMSAARIAWLLYWIGCDHIRILIGSIDPSSIVFIPSSSPNLPKKPRRSQCRIICSDLINEFPSTTTSFIDVRTYAEYSGQITGYPYVRYAGRIARFQHHPLNGICGRIPGTTSWNRLEDYLRLMLTTTDRSSRMIFMCGTGWRASLAAIFAHILELSPIITVLDSGWLEWSERFLCYESPRK